MKNYLIAGLSLLILMPSSNGDENASTGALVDLSDNRVLTADNGSVNSHVLSNPWWKNLDLYGFAGVGFYDTGAGGTRASGGFEIKEVSLFLEADVWDNSAVFVELQVNRLGKDDQLFTRTGEVYLHFRDVRIANAPAIGVKFGRFDVPFGEEYLWQDAIDNPLITNSAAYPYGWDEGVLVYADVGRWSWIAAITDGTDSRSREENSDKALNFKISSQLHNSLYASFSAMRNGDVSKSAVEFGGSHFQPVGASHISTLGVSPSTEVAATMIQIDAKLDFQLRSQYSGYLAMSAGGARQSDDALGFDRDIQWFSIEPLVNVGSSTYVIGRYSEIGTYDNNEGYHFDGKTFAGGNSAFGYDTRKFRRLAIGAGRKLNPRMTAKLEIGKDWFDLIDASVLPNAAGRAFFGLEFATRF